MILKCCVKRAFVKGLKTIQGYVRKGARLSSVHARLNYFPDDFLLFVDDYHVTIPQVRGMLEVIVQGKTALSILTSGFPRPMTTGR